MKLGLENKKELAILGVLMAVVGIMVYRNMSSEPSQPAAKPAAPAAASPASIQEPVTQAAAVSDTSSASRRTRQGSEEFHPVMRPKRVEDRIDPMKVDPTLHLEILARLQNAAAEGTGRNVFQFGAPPPPPPPASASRMVVAEPVVIPRVTPVAASMAPSVPPPPPIPLKFYAMSTVRATGKKSAIFKQGDNILIAREGDTMMNRYRVVRIGVNSVTVEDTQQKREQTLPLAEDADGPG